MWNVDFTGSPADASVVIRQAVIDDAGVELVRQARIFGKYLEQLSSAFEAVSIHVTTTGSISSSGASGVTFAVEVLS